MADILKFTGKTVLDTAPDSVLDAAKGRLSTVFIAGYDTECDFYFSSSTSNTAEILFMLDKFRFQVMRGDFNAD